MGNLTSIQCRMARAGLKLSTKDLAALAGTDPMTINRFENDKDTLASTASKIAEALIETGEVELLENNAVRVTPK